MAELDVYTNSESMIYGFIGQEPPHDGAIKLEHYDLTYRKGESILKQGTIVPHVVFIKSGMVKIMLESANRKQPLCIEKAGFIGLESMYNDKFSQYSVIALTDADICLIEIESFKRVLNTNPAFAVKIIETLNTRTKLLYERIITLTQKQAQGRVADILMCLSGRIFESDTFCSPCTRTEMAEMCALSLESLSRVLKEFKDEGIIDVTAQTISILNKKELELISRVS
jgi:CRP/FNR family transcriptional regulator